MLLVNLVCIHRPWLASPMHTQACHNVVGFLGHHGLLQPHVVCDAILYAGSQSHRKQHEAAADAYSADTYSADAYSATPSFGCLWMAWSSTWLKHLASTHQNFLASSFHCCHMLMTSSSCPPQQLPSEATRCPGKFLQGSSAHSQPK